MTDLRAGGGDSASDLFDRWMANRDAGAVDDDPGAGVHEEAQTLVPEPAVDQVVVDRWMASRDGGAVDDPTRVVHEPAPAAVLEPAVDQVIPPAAPTPPPSFTARLLGRAPDELEESARAEAWTAPAVTEAAEVEPEPRPEPELEPDPLPDPEPDPVSDSGPDREPAPVKAEGLAAQLAAAAAAAVQPAPAQDRTGSPTVRAADAQVIPAYVPAERLREIGPAGKPQAPPQADDVPAVTEFAPRNGTRLVTGALLTAALIAALISAYMAYQERTVATVGIVCTLFILVLVIWASRASSAPATLRINSGHLTVTQTSGIRHFDLASSYTPLQVVGRPGLLGWKVVIGQGQNEPFVIDATMVEPKAFMRVLRYYRPEL